MNNNIIRPEWVPSGYKEEVKIDDRDADKADKSKIDLKAGNGISPNTVVDSDDAAPPVKE